MEKGTGKVVVKKSGTRRWKKYSVKKAVKKGIGWKGDIEKQLISDTLFFRFTHKAYSLVVRVFLLQENELGTR